MRTNEPSTAQWGDTEQCPFCQAELTDGGAGFIDHISDRPGCHSEFDDWRGRVRDDVMGGWSG